MHKILLIEDDELVRDMLSRRLARRGFDVACASDGAEGLALGLAESPELILLDLRLPEVSGWELIRKFKADPRTKAVPLIVLTAQAMSSDRERCFDLGCDAFETKPVDFPRLMAQVAALLGAEPTG